MYNSPVDTPQGSRQTKYPNFRAVAQSGSALAWGARGRGFESRLPDTTKSLVTQVAKLFVVLATLLFFRTHDPAGGVGKLRVTQQLAPEPPEHLPAGTPPTAGRGGRVESRLPDTTKSLVTQVAKLFVVLATLLFFRTHDPAGGVGKLRVTQQLAPEPPGHLPAGTPPTAGRGGRVESRLPDTTKSLVTQVAKLFCCTCNTPFFSNPRPRRGSGQAASDAAASSANFKSRYPQG